MGDETIEENNDKNGQVRKEQEDNVSMTNEENETTVPETVMEQVQEAQTSNLEESAPQETIQEVSEAPFESAAVDENPVQDTSRKLNSIIPKFRMEPIKIDLDFSALDRTIDSIRNMSMMRLPQAFTRKPKNNVNAEQRNVEQTNDKIEDRTSEINSSVEVAPPSLADDNENRPSSVQEKVAEEGEKEANDLKDQAAQIVQDVVQGASKRYNFLPKFRGNNNRLEPINLGIDLSSIDRTLENLKQRTKIKMPNKREQSSSSKSKKKKNNDKTNSETSIAEVVSQNGKISIDMENDLQIAENPYIKTNHKIVFAAPDQPGSPFIPIKAYKHESSGLMVNEINDHHSGDDGNHNSMSLVNPLHFEVIWRNLTYYPPDIFKTQSSNTKHKVSPEKSKKPILNNISGMFRSGQLTGIMGPSGSGKTILLNCIAGFIRYYKREENSGDILVNGVNSIRIGFVEQFDHLYPFLTVRETLLFASKIRNAARYYLNHEKVVKNVMKRLDLLDLAKNRVSKCSNGQRKRISIAIELVFNSDILMLDEPTSGVDTVNGHHIMSILKSLTKRRRAIAIVASIHQPNTKIFSLFDSIILLSKEGTIIFEGPPADLSKTLELVGLSCPMYTSIADFALEVASGDHGRQSLHLLTHYHNEYNQNRFTEDFNEVEMHSLREAVKCAHVSDQRSVFLCTMLVIWRNLISGYRDPFNLRIRVVALFFLGILLALLFNNVGEISTCPTKYFLWNVNMEDLFQTIEDHTFRSRENVALMFIVGLISLFNSMLNLAISIPMEIYVFRREYNNYSFSIFTYYIAKIISQLPFTLTTTAMFVLCIHRLTDQIFDGWYRIYLFMLPFCIVTLIGQFLGILVGVVFYKNQIQAVFALTFILIPIMLCSGFFKLIKNMNEVFYYLSYGSFLKSGLHAALIVVYGIDRCSFQNQLEYEAIQANQNGTGDYERPHWIDNVVTLIDFQASMMNESTKSDLVPQAINDQLDPEDKLTLYLGLREDSEENNRATVLQYLGISSTLNSYWDQIMELCIICILYAIIVYLIMVARLKRQKN